MSRPVVSARYRDGCILDKVGAYSRQRSPVEGPMIGRRRRASLLIALPLLGLSSRSMSAQMDTSKSRPDSARPAPAARPRERPAMVACPWPLPSTVADTLIADPKAPPAPAGVVDPPRARIPDCAPPDWKAPSSLKAFTPAPLPKDRPKPLVDDYLRYV